MISQEPPDIPEWLKPGTRVLVYSRGGISTHPNPVQTTIKKVAQKTFTVKPGKNGDEPRFKSDTQESARQGGTWTRYSRRVVPIDSEEARKVLAQQKQERAEDALVRAFDQWDMERKGRGSGAAYDDSLRALREAVQSLIAVRGE